MKKFAYLAAILLLAIGLSACQKTGAENADNADAANDKNVQTAADNNAKPAPPQKIPAWQEKAEAMDKSSVEWTSDHYKFGKVKNGEIVRHTFTFKNTGDHDIVIQRAKASCGCTVPTHTKDPIAPGETGEIKIEFNSTGRTGVQSKNITVTGNFTDNINKVLKISGEVMPPEAADGK